MARRARRAGSACGRGLGGSGEARATGWWDGQDTEGMDGVLVLESVSASLCGPDKRLL